ncbi:MAG: hypothetical protein ACYTEQ_30145, partial [Planctomycetota bacterium]
MSNELAKMALLSLLPPGSAWRVKDNGDWDALLEGQATNWESVREDLDTLSEIRRPLTTPILSDLEKEFGVTPNPELDDDTRRQRLAALVYAPDGTGSASYLQARLQEAGFDVYVYANDPAVNPIPFIDDPNGELIVAGDIFRNELDFIAQCGINEIQCGTAEAVCGSADFDISPIEYPDPTDPNRWRFVFFVGQAPQSVYLQDGDMEKTGLDDWSIEGSINVTKATDEVYEGSQSLRIDTPQGVANSGAQTPVIVPSDPSVVYVLSGANWYASSAALRGKIAYGSSGFAVWNSSGDNARAGAWQTFNVIYDPHQAGADFMRLSFASNLTGPDTTKQYWDALTMTPAKSLVTDGNMEIDAVANWPATGTASVSESFSSFYARSLSKTLKVDSVGVIGDGAHQVFFTPSASTFEVRAWTRAASPVLEVGIYQNGVLRHTYAGSVNWEYAEITLNTADGMDIKFAPTGSITASFYVDTAQYSKDTVNFHSGTQSMLVDGGAQFEGFSTEITVSRDTSIKYLFNMWTRNTAGERAYLRDSGGAAVHRTAQYPYGVWKENNYIWDADSLGTTVQFVTIGGNPSVTDFWNLDDVTVTPVTQLLDGGQCETGDDSFWATDGGIGIAIESGSTVIRSGSRCFRISNSANGDGIYQA